MYLFEEYLQRHQMTIPVVHHCSAGIVILQNQKKLKTVFFIDRIEDDAKPCYYQITVKSPIHNGFKQNLFFKQEQVFNLKWHEYEDFFWSWAKQNENYEVVSGKNNIFLASLEILAFVYDSWFSEQSYSIKEMLFNAIDNESDLEKRCENYWSLFKYLYNFEPKIYERFQINLLSKTKNYSEWLVKFLNSRWQMPANRILYEGNI